MTRHRHMMENSVLIIKEGRSPSAQQCLRKDRHTCFPRARGTEIESNKRRQWKAHSSWLLMLTCSSCAESALVVAGARCREAPLTGSSLVKSIMFDVTGKMLQVSAAKDRWPGHKGSSRVLSGFVSTPTTVPSHTQGSQTQPSSVGNLGNPGQKIEGMGFIGYVPTVLHSAWDPTGSQSIHW